VLPRAGYQRVEHIEPCRVVIDPLAVLRKAFAYLVEHGGEVAHWSGML
jgi:hypothetical protein